MFRLRRVQRLKFEAQVALSNNVQVCDATKAEACPKACTKKTSSLEKEEEYLLTHPWQKLKTAG